MHRARPVLLPLRWRLSSATDPVNPPIGTIFYLVTRVDACGESMAGQGSGGQNPNPFPCP